MLYFASTLPDHNMQRNIQTEKAEKSADVAVLFDYLSKRTATSGSLVPKKTDYF